MPSQTEFTGEWKVVSSPDFDDDYLNEGEPPFVKLKQKKDKVAGTYTLGYQTGGIDGYIDTENENRLIFSFEGMDDADQVDGAGIALLTNDHLTFTLMYHLGDRYTFACERKK